MNITIIKAANTTKNQVKAIIGLLHNEKLGTIKLPWSIPTKIQNPAIVTSGFDVEPLLPCIGMNTSIAITPKYAKYKNGII